MIDILVIALICLGLLFFLGATVGIIRFPDFYTRMHAAGKGDTLSTLLMLLGFAVYNLHHFTWLNLLVSLKIMFISVFIFVTSPTTTHAVMDAGYAADIEPWQKDEKTEDPS